MVKMQGTKVIQGGYSDIRLWPCYMIFSGSMLFLMPQIGFFTSLILVGTPFFILARWVAYRQPREIFDVVSWNKDIKIALEKGTLFPDASDYWRTVGRKPIIANKVVSKTNGQSTKVTKTKHWKKQLSYSS